MAARRDRDHGEGGTRGRSSPKLPPGGITTRVGTRIVPGRVEELAGLVTDFRPDLVVAGELIEHTPDTLGWLSRLAAAAPGFGFLATTPNTTSVINMLLALLGRENNHPDHLHMYSYKTLATLATRVPLRNPTLTPYYYDPHIFRGRLPALPRRSSHWPTGSYSSRCSSCSR